MFTTAFSGLASIVIMLFSLVVPDGFAAIGVFVLGLLLLAATIWAAVEDRYAFHAGHRAGIWHRR